MDSPHSTITLYPALRVYYFNYHLDLFFIYFQVLHVYTRTTLHTRPTCHVFFIVSVHDRALNSNFLV